MKIILAYKKYFIFVLTNICYVFTEIEKWTWLCKMYICHTFSWIKYFHIYKYSKHSCNTGWHMGCIWKRYMRPQLLNVLYLCFLLGFRAIYCCNENPFCLFLKLNVILLHYNKMIITYLLFFMFYWYVVSI